MTEGSSPVIDKRVQASENEYYSAHAWCLNPILRLSDLFRRFDEEIRHYNSWPEEWQRKESRINFYLFASAVSCIVDDYVFRRPWEPAKVLGLLGRFSPAGRVIIGIADLPYTFSSRMKLGKLGRWKSEWDRLLEETCRLLVKDTEPTTADMTGIESRFTELRKFRLPQKLLQQRMRIMEGYRRQDLTHHDLVTLSNRFAENRPARDSHIVVVGPRTAGTYFAPVVKANLDKMGFRNVSWITIRPRMGLFPAETKRLKRMLDHDAEVVIVDDYSNTGLTFRLAQDSLSKLGVPANKMTLLAPLHPRKPEVHLTDNHETRVIRLDHKDLYKSEVLERQNADHLLAHYFSSQAISDFRLRESQPLRETNSRLTEHYNESFQARLKRVYEAGSSSSESLPAGTKVFAKSVGWGWLGYHAYIAANRMREFVPELIGLRNGILYSKWVDGKPVAARDLPDENITRMGSYVAFRALRLPVGEDPRFGKADVHSGWREIVSVLKGPYPSRTGILKHKVIEKYLRGSLSPHPSLVDGRMTPQKWLANGDTITKIDFEHHNFGEPELDVVDPAYDLAAASFEFEMSETEDEKLLKAYSENCGDDGIRDRIFLYKLLYAYHARKITLFEILEKEGHSQVPELNRRYIRSWNSLIYNMNRYNGKLVHKPVGKGSSDRLFFLDIDDVFDWFSFGFPHTTPSGLEAVSILHEQGFTIIPNTGRSVEHVYNYCSAYGFRYGVAEYGGVFVNNADRREISLIDDQARKQIEVCRTLLEKAEGVFVDQTYRYCIRAYRFSSYGTEPLNEHEVRDIIRNNGLDRLKSISRPDATYFSGEDTGKGRALEFVRDYLGCPRERTFAIGDSDVDIPMLQKAGHGYAPANCSTKVRELARKNGCRVVAGCRQRGLLDAVNEIVKSEAGTSNGGRFADEKSDSLRKMMFSLMTRAEQSRLRRLAASFWINRL